MGFPRQEYWSGLPCPPPGDLSDPGIEPVSPALQADSLPLSHQVNPDQLLKWSLHQVLLRFPAECVFSQDIDQDLSLFQKVSELSPSFSPMPWEGVREAPGASFCQGDSQDRPEIAIMLQEPRVGISVGP